MGNLFSLCIEDEELITPKIPYSEKYLNKFNELKIVKDVDRDYKQVFLFEAIPYGDSIESIIMKYDSEDNMFHYYCNRSIPNSILETVSQKFVIQFNCKYIYHLSDNSDENKENGEKIERKLPDVYGKFKKQKTKRIEVQSNINRYKYVGKLSSFSFLNPIRNQYIESKQLSYKDFVSK